MTGRFLVEPLGSTHNRRDFTCGVDVLDRYFRDQAAQDIRRRLANCFVAIDVAADAADDVAGYYTFSATSLLLSDLSADDTKRLPRYPVVPAGLIGRLAVASRFAGQGLGAALILDAVSRATRAELAIFALVVEAKTDAAQRFYEHLGFRPLVSRPGSLYWPVGEAARRLHA